MILLALLQAATPLPPAAPERPPATMVVEPIAMAIAAWDADDDARTSAAEAAAGTARSFAAIDRTGSGAIGYIAFADWAARELGDRAALPSPFEVDADGDNRITLAELQAQVQRTVVRLDRDRDGFVTRAECLTLRTPAPGLGRRRR